MNADRANREQEATYADTKQSQRMDDDPPEESPLLDGLERFSEMLDELYDDVPGTPKCRRRSPLSWEGNGSQIAVRGLGRLLAKWRRIGRQDRPPPDLVVRLAKRLTGAITELGQAPRRRLRRVRSMEPLNRLRELDSGCMQWLVKQPGRTLTEKAGQKRALKVVQRFESIDTLENRVFVEFMKRARSLAKRYLREYSESYPSHPWIEVTRKLLRICDHFLGIPEFRTVGSLTSVPQPNYVLLHDSQYHGIWWGYLQLVKQTERRRHLWMQRNAAWQEMNFVALLSSMAEAVKRQDRDQYKMSLRFDVRIHSRTIEGCKLDLLSFSPRWQVASSKALTVLTGRQWRLLDSSTAKLPRELGLGIFFESHGRFKAIELAPFLNELSGARDEQDVLVRVSECELNRPGAATERNIQAPLRLTDYPGFWDSFCAELFA